VERGELSALGTGETVLEVAMGTGSTYCHAVSINHKNDHDRPRQAGVGMSRHLIATFPNWALKCLQYCSVELNYVNKNNIMVAEIKGLTLLITKPRI
jgi:hypothetical protein